MTTSPHPVRRTLRLFVGWCALLLYVGLVSPVGPGLALLLGSLDADHRVGIEAGTDSVRVVLHHDLGCSPHRHGMVARVLTCFAPPVTATQPDHVLQFSGGVSFSRLLPSVRIVPTVAHLAVATEEESLKVAALEPLLSIVSTHPPPGECGTLLQLRSILLLL